MLMRRNLNHFCVASAHGEIWNPDEHGQKSLEIVLSLQIVPIINSPARSSFDKKRRTDERNLDIILECVDDQLLAEEGRDTGQHPGS